MKTKVLIQHLIAIQHIIAVVLVAFGQVHIFHQIYVWMAELDIGSAGLVQNPTWAALILLKIVFYYIHTVIGFYITHTSLTSLREYFNCLREYFNLTRTKDDPKENCTGCEGDGREH